MAILLCNTMLPNQLDNIQEMCPLKSPEDLEELCDMAYQITFRVITSSLCIPKMITQSYL